MEGILIFGLMFTIALATRHEDPGRQEIINGRYDQRQSRGRYNMNVDNDDRGNGPGRFRNGPYGCPGCGGWQNGRRGRGPWGRMREYGPGGPRRGYGPGGPMWGHGRGGHHRMFDAFETGMNYGPMRGHGRGFHRGHGHWFRYFEDMCPTSCPQWEIPVCASNGQTYENRCAMRMESCRTGESLTVEREGRC